MSLGDLGSIANLLAAIATTDYFTKIGSFDREPSPTAS